MASLVHWNIRGARANQAWLSHNIFGSAQIVALQKTLLNTGTPFTIPGKIVYRLDRPSGSGGGLIVAVSARLPSSKMDFSRSSSTAEILGVQVKVTRSLKLTIINVYAPRGQIENGWLEEIRRECSPPFFIVGDFNAHHPMWGSPRASPGGNLLASWITENNMCLLNTQFPTRVGSRGPASLLDLSLANPDMVGDSTLTVYPDPFGSDHHPIIINWQTNQRGSNGVVRLRYDWGSLTSSLNSNLRSKEKVSYEEFNGLCSQSLKENKRISIVKMRSGADWWDSRLSYLLGQKRKFFRKARNELSADLWIKYKHASAKLRREMNEARRIFWGRTCKNTSKSGRIYKILKNLQDRQAPTPDSYKVIQVENGESNEASDEANAFANRYYRPPGEKVPLDFGVNHNPRIRENFSMDELVEALNKGAAKTPGKDEIPLRLLRGLDQRSKGILLQSFNEIWQKVEIPPLWQESIIVPILKPGRDSKSPGSYRPISLTSTVSKVFERMLMRRMTKWMMEKNIFHQNHYGFLPFRDSSAAVVKLYDGLSRARANKKHAILLILDITEAYDSVCHDLLALKLLTAGLDGHLTYWIYEFLTKNRYQVRWKNALSDMYNQEVGVPQGRVLSPYLFTLYMRDFFETLEFGVEGIVYADDVFVYATGDTFEEASKKIQGTVQNISKWGKYWKMNFNSTKSMLLNVSNKRRKPDAPIYLGGQPIPWAKSAKILGMWFSTNLKWNRQIAELKKRTYRKINVFKYIASPRRGIGTRDLLKIANAGVISLMQYGSQLHSLASRSELKKLEPVRNLALRIATGLPKWTPIPILRKITKVSSLEDCHKLHRNIFIIRHLALGEFSPLEMVFQNQGEFGVFAELASELLNDLNMDRCNILTGAIVQAVPDTVHVYYEIADHPFQNKSLHPEVIKCLFKERMELWGEWYKIATDASKTSTYTSIGIWNVMNEEGLSRNLHPVNSIFTAEALALREALEQAPRAGKLMLLSDSKSVILALRNVHQKSQKVIINLHERLIQVGRRLEEIRIVWVPGHCGIQCNEKADEYAGIQETQLPMLQDISPEDIVQFLRKRQQKEDGINWILSKYVNKFPHLTRSSWEHRKLRLPRQGEVQLVRLQTQTLPTNALLFRLGLTNSPYCRECNVPETTEHFLLECRRFREEREKLYLRLGESSNTATFWSLCDLVISGRRSSRALVSFLLSSARF